METCWFSCTKSLSYAGRVVQLLEAKGITLGESRKKDLPDNGYTTNMICDRSMWCRVIHVAYPHLVDKARWWLLLLLFVLF